MSDTFFLIGKSGGTLDKRKLVCVMCGTELNPKNGKMYDCVFDEVRLSFQMCSNCAIYTNKQPIEIKENIFLSFITELESGLRKIK